MSAETSQPTSSRPASDSLLRSSAVMAAGTVVSRLTGFVRLALIAAALGVGLRADQFNLPNTIPNALYILIAGGVFNAVLVPQLVRAMRNDEDGGDAYANRILTLAVLFLASVTILLVVAAPLVVRLYVSGVYFTPELAAQRESLIAFAQLCLPQVFFYGLFVVLGQILNARGRFAPMMWAPIANNLIACATFGIYLWVYGAQGGSAAFSTSEELLLGLGSTLGIVVQTVILFPYLRAAGFRIRSRFDFRGTGLSHTARIAVWTVLFVIVNQITYVVVARLASQGSALAVTQGVDEATGYTVYANAYLIFMVPHSVVTVSLATAALPALSRLAAAGNRKDLATQTAKTLRLATAFAVPAAVAFFVLALPVATVIFGWGASAGRQIVIANALGSFALALVPFTIHYLVLRAFYAMEDTRTPFFVQCVIMVANITLALTFVELSRPDAYATSLALAFAAAYVVGATTSAFVLARRLHASLGMGWLLWHLLRLVVAAGIAFLVAGYVITELIGVGERNPAEALLQLVLVGTVAALIFIGLAKALRIGEVDDVVGVITRRLRRRSRSA